MADLPKKVKYFQVFSIILITTKSPGAKKHTQDTQPHIRHFGKPEQVSRASSQIASRYLKKTNFSCILKTVRKLWSNQRESLFQIEVWKLREYKEVSEA